MSLDLSRSSRLVDGRRRSAPLSEKQERGGKRVSCFPCSVPRAPRGCGGNCGDTSEGESKAKLPNRHEEGGTGLVTKL